MVEHLVEHFVPVIRRLLKDPGWGNGRWSDHQCTHNSMMLSPYDMAVSYHASDYMVARVDDGSLVLIDLVVTRVDKRLVPTPVESVEAAQAIVALVGEK